MVKYIATKREGDVIVANFEEQKVSKATYGSGYDYSYTITEPGEWIVDDEKLFDVEEGDVVFKMYSVTHNWEEKEYIKLSRHFCFSSSNIFPNKLLCFFDLLLLR